MSHAANQQPSASRPPDPGPAPGSGFNSEAVMLTPEMGAARLARYAATFETAAEWAVRAAQVKAAMMRGAELDPWPSLPAPEAVLHSSRTYDGYRVENVYFESFPGFYVTGNLYRPLDRTPPFPGILVNMGHAPLSRHDADHQHLAATLAGMGAVVFIYDMMGYGESHQPGKPVPEQDHHFVKSVKLELFNALRSLDFLISLEDVDPGRIAVTGASGGGSRTMFLTALDPRVRVCAPLIMVSNHFYGGCVCESGMPICYQASVDTVLADIAALAAPRPMLVVSVGGDWTHTVPESEYPYIRRVYSLYDAADRVSLVHLPEESHDLGFSKRRAVYGFFAEKLQLSPFDHEQRTCLETWSQQKAFTQAHPRPANVLAGEAAILEALDRISR